MATLTLQDMINKIGATRVSSDLLAQGIKPVTSTTPSLSQTIKSPSPVYNTMTLTDAASSFNPLSLQGDGGGMAGELNGGINAPAYKAYQAQLAQTEALKNQIIPDQYKNSPYASYFSNVKPLDYETSKFQFNSDGGFSTADDGGMYHDTEKTNQLDYLDAYKKISAAPISVSIPDLLKSNPQAAYFSPEVQKAFADNYRLGYASLYKPVYGDNVMPTSQGNINLLKNGKSDYWAVDPTNLNKTYWDPNLGLQIDKKYVVEPKRGLGPIPAVAGLLASVAMPALLPSLGALGSIGSGAVSGALGGGITSAVGGDSILKGALTGGLAGGLGSGLSDLFPTTSPITAGSNAISSAGTNAANITSDILSKGSNVSNAFNLSQLLQDPSSIMHVGDTDNMLPGTSLASGNSGITGLTSGGTGLTNAASTGGAVASDVLGAGGTSALTAANGLGGLSSNLGGGLLATAGGVVPAATAVASAAGSSITDYVTDLFSGGVDKFMKDPVSNSLKLGSGIISYLQSQGKASDLQNLLNQGLSQSDPFGSQRSYYAGRLKDTYTNPTGVMNSPEYQAVRAKELDALERADAAQGRKSQYGARAEKMNQNFMEYLNKERTTLAGLAGSGISPSQVSSLLEKLGVGSSDAQINGTGQLIFALNQILSGK